MRKYLITALLFFPLIAMTTSPDGCGGCKSLRKVEADGSHYTTGWTPLSYSDGLCTGSSAPCHVSETPKCDSHWRVTTQVHSYYTMKAGLAFNPPGWTYYDGHNQTDCGDTHTAVLRALGCETEGDVYDFQYHKFWNAVPFSDPLPDPMPPCSTSGTWVGEAIHEVKCSKCEWGG